MDAVALTVAVGLVPDRMDGLLSLHVGNSYVLLMPAEMRRLMADINALIGPLTAGTALKVYRQDMQ